MSAAMVARRRRAPLLALAVVALFAGLWGGLIRLGLSLPSAVTSAAELHGPLMALGFLGMLVSLERAVALDRPWAYVAPLAAGAGALSALAGAPDSLGPALVTLGGAVLLAAHLVLQRLQPSAHNAVMGLGAVAWCAAAVLWLTGADVSRFAPLLAGFLVLTIVGERLELSRLRRPSRAARALLLAAVGAFSAGVALAMWWPGAGVRLAGAGLVAQAAWLARHDVARHTIRGTGAPRYMAVALIAGYVWLAVAGAVWTAQGAFAGGGFAYDAMVHAIFLGFVFSMVFAHAQVIVPAVLGVALPHGRAFYAPLALLHAGLVLRLAGDAAGSIWAWRWGGATDELAIVAFLGVAVAAARRGRRRRPAGAPVRGARPPAPVPIARKEVAGS
jgi:hypothetical protein